MRARPAARPTCSTASGACSSSSRAAARAASAWCTGRMAARTLCPAMTRPSTVLAISSEGLAECQPKGSNPVTTIMVPPRGSSFVLALFALVALHHLTGRLVALLEPGQRAPGAAQALDVTDDPAPSAHPRVRGEGSGVDGPSLILSSEAYPEVGILGPQRKAGEEPRPHEVAPAPEHRCNLHLRPRAEDLVEGAGRTRASARETPARAASASQPADAAWARYGQTCE